MIVLAVLGYLVAAVALGLVVGRAIRVADVLDERR